MTRWKRDTRNLYFLFTLLSFHAQRRQWHPTPVILPGKSHGRRSLVGCSPCGREESDTTEWLHFHFSLSFTGEGNGNPLQCSCLENPRDGEPGGLPSMGSHRVRHDWSDLAAAAAALTSSPTNTSPHCQLLRGEPSNQPHSFPAPRSILLLPVPPTSAQPNLFTFPTPVPPMPPTPLPPPALTDSFPTLQGRTDAFELWCWRRLLNFF